MERVCDYNICTGCGICAVQCPKQSIEMRIQGSQGHLYPFINQDNCIDCGLCQKTCPSIHSHVLKFPITAYAAWSKDIEDYMSSTSGGAASVISQHILSNGGVVYGCAMLPDINVKHIRVDKIDDVHKLKGSKYVQSDITEIISQLKIDVKEGRYVLFTGTPCQVAAIRSLYKEQPDNLLLVDLICHGVPSVYILKKHIKKIADYPHYDKVIFRDGKDGYVVGVVVDGEIVYKQSLTKNRYKDWYINTFFDGYTYRASCYQCRYACPERVSDITIGDFWGLGKGDLVDEIPKHEYGCSVILPNTTKGCKTIKLITPLMNLYERHPKEAIEGNDQLRHPCLINWRIRFYRKFCPKLSENLYYWVNVDKIVKNRIKTFIKR